MQRPRCYWQFEDIAAVEDDGNLARYKRVEAGECPPRVLYDTLNKKL